MPRPCVKDQVKLLFPLINAHLNFGFQKFQKSHLKKSRREPDKNKEKYRWNSNLAFESAWRKYKLLHMAYNSWQSTPQHAGQSLLLLTLTVPNPPIWIRFCTHPRGLGLLMHRLLHDHVSSKAPSQNVSAKGISLQKCCGWILFQDRFPPPPPTYKAHIYPLYRLPTEQSVVWPSGLVRWTQVLALPECEFESRPGQLQRLCPWARHLTIIALSIRMGRKAVGPVCCVMHVKEPRITYHEREGACPGVSGFAPWAPSRVDMCALQILSLYY